MLRKPPTSFSLVGARTGRRGAGGGGAAARRSRAAATTRPLCEAPVLHSALLRQCAGAALRRCLRRAVYVANRPALGRTAGSGRSRPRARSRARCGPRGPRALGPRRRAGPARPARPAAHSRDGGPESKKNASAPTGAELDRAAGRRGSGVGPVSPRAQRTDLQARLGGHDARPRLELVGDLRAAGPRCRSRRRPGATAATRSSTSAGVSSPSQPAPITAPTRRSCGRRATAAASITASHSGLARPGSSPCASTSPPTST